MMLSFTSVDHALYEVSRTLLSSHAHRVKRRGQFVAEMPHPISIRITDPRQRLVTLPARKLNPWVALAEFPWLLSGRNDISWLLPYLPRAAMFADDGQHWRAGYGPRMRRWDPDGMGEVDQLAAVVRRLEKDPLTRQAVISLWDPMSDNLEGSTDYPCTNWLHFQRTPHTGALDLHVAMRSNDLWWGFSGVNAVNFTLLQELVAACLGCPLGTYYHTVTNMHLYLERHGAAARELVDGPSPADDFAARPEPFPITEPDGGAASERLRRFTDDAKRAVYSVEMLRSGEPGVELPENLHPWLYQWARFMLRHTDAQRGDYSSFTDQPWPEDWKMTALNHKAQGVAK